jgi:phage tail protein X
MNATYETQPGDVLDAICHKHYGKTSGNIERVLEANPGLADLDVVLPLGTLIVLPDLPAENESTPILETARLWD